MISESGLYNDVPEAKYHADPVISPSLSSSICKLMVARSPLHAWQEHPRLNKAKALEVEAPSRAMDVGTAVHKTILGKGRELKEIVADDYKTKAAREERDAARALGLTPVLSEEMERVTLLAEAARDQLAGTELDGIFDRPGSAEVTGVWRDRFGNWRRMRVDWLPDDARHGGHVLAVDLKTTGGSAAPEDWQRVAFDLGYDIQDAFYRDGLNALLPNVRSVTFKFITLEQAPPYGLTINEFSGQALYEAAELVELGARMWAACMKRGEWPGYVKETTHMEPPKWRSERSEIRRLAMQRRVEHWQRPLELEKGRPA